MGVVLSCGLAAEGGWLVTNGLRELCAVYLMCHGNLLEYLLFDMIEAVDA